MSLIKKIFINILIIFILSATSSYAEEIKKLGKSLRATIKKGLIEKESIQERLNYLEYISTLTEDPFIQQKIEGGFTKNIVNPQ